MKAAEWSAMQPNPHHSMADASRTAAALTIAARALDDGAEHEIALALRSVGGLYNRIGAQAVLSYLRGKDFRGGNGDGL